MKPREFARIQTEEPVAESLQDRVQEFARPMAECNLVDGVLLTDIAVSHATQFDLDHGLGRLPEGYIITKSVTDCVCIREVSSTSTTATLHPMLFLGGGSATIDLWVF